MEMALNMGAFEALDSLEIFAVDGGDKARQERVDALRASGQSIGSTTKAAVNTQATVTGWALALVGVAAAIPTCGASLGLSLALPAVSLGVASAGLVSL